MAQVDATLGVNSLAKSRIPDDCFIYPLRPGVTIVFNFETGEDPQFKDGASDTLTFILPPEFQWNRILSVMHVIDRGSVGRGTVWFGSTVGKLCWAFAWGQNHDEWGALRYSAKQVSGGRL